MSTVTTPFAAVLDGTQQYYRPRLPYEFNGQDNDLGYSAIWHAADILAVDQTNQNELYNYAKEVFTPTVSGNYTLTVDSAVGLVADGRSDTQIWLYDTTFDPLNPLANIIAANEDIDFRDQEGQPVNWLSHLPNMPLIAGHTYVLVVTTYAADATGSANFSATGPGELILGDAPPDTTASLVESVGVPGSGTYAPGEHFDFTVTFDETVLVDTGAGTPMLGLVIGGQSVQAAYTGGSGTRTLTFRYTLLEGQEDNDGIEIGALALHGGTIRDIAGNDADITLQGVNDTSSVLVGSAPPSVVVVVAPTAGTYAQGGQLNFTVILDEAVTVDTSGGTPRIALVIGSQTVYANYVSGSGSTALVFQHTLATGMTDSDGITVGAWSANGGTVKDAFGNDAALALNNVSSTTGVLVDSVAPAVLSVAVPAAGTYALGGQLNFTVTLDDAITVDTSGGTPRIALVIGSQTVYATYVSGSGTTALVFRHTLASDRLDTDGITIGALSANGGTLKDAAGNDAALALQGVASTAAVLVDSGAPSITGNISVPGAGAYRAGEVLTFTATFDENIIVTGTDSALTLTIGSTSRLATFASKTQNSITYTYTVQAGDNDTNGIAVNSLSAGTGTIRDAAGNDAALTLFRHVPSTASILVDTKAPAVTGVTVPANGTRTAGTVLDFTVTFDENVTVTGTDGTLALTIGATARSATFLSSSGNTVTYRYTVQASDNDADGIAVGAISTGTGAIRDAAGNNAALSLVGRVPSTAGIMVDTQAPAVTGVTVPPDGIRAAGAVLDFTVTFGEAVTVTGTNGSMALTIGGTARNATFLSSGGNTITYRYTVQAGDNDADGIAIGAISAGTGTIRDAAGNNAVLSLAGLVPSTAGITVDTQGPAVTGVTLPPNGTHTAGAVLEFTVAFDEAVTVTGTDGTLALTVGGTARSATFLSSSGNTITYRYTVQPGDNDADGIAVGAVSTGTGAIRDAAGNNAALSLAGHVPPTAGIVVDARAPAVSGVSVPPGGTHGAGTQLDFTVTFDEAVSVTDTDGTLALTIGGTARNATFLSSSGNTITYRYTVQPGDNDADGIAVGALSTGTGAIRDAAGNDAALSLAGHVPSTAGIVVDTQAPAVTGVTVPLDGTHTAGTVLDFTIAFNEAVAVTGTDGTLALTIGGTARSAIFLSSSGNTVTYRYTVQPGDNDADGITVGTVSTGTGAIRDAAGNDAALSLAGHVPSTAGITVDTQAPAVTGVTVPPGGTHGAGTQLDFTVAFDEVVVVTGTDGMLALTIGGTARSAIFLSSSGNTVTYRYTVQPGDNDADGITVGAVSTGTGAIRDAAGNDAALSLAGHVPSTAGIVVDTQAPAVTGVTVPPGGTHGAGTQLDFTVAFDEAVAVTGTDGTLALTIGGTARSATFLSSSGNTVTYRYTVQPGDNDADGITVGAVSTGSGAIRDAAGNDASLSLAGHVPSTAGIVVDTQAPAVAGVTVPPGGTHGVGTQLDFTVAFDEAVAVTGTDGTLALTIGGTARSATFLSSSGNTVTYRYTVQPGDNDADGIAIGAVSTGSGAIRDAAGNDASLSLAGHVPSTAGIVVDTRAPAVTAVTVPPSGTHGAGTALDFTVAFDEVVVVTGTDGTLALTIGGTARSATFLSSSGNTVTYRYIVQPGDNDADGIAVGALVLGTSTIRDAAGNDAALALAGHVPATGGIQVDADAPAVSGAIGIPAAGTYITGNTLVFTVTFDSNVVVQGGGSVLGLMIGGVAREAVLVAAPGTATLTYAYTVQPGDSDADGIAVTAIALNGSTIRDAAGNDASLALAGHVPPLGNVLVDTLAPSVAGIAAPAADTYRAGETLSFTVSFDEAVTVAGTDSTLALTVGRASRAASFVSSNGNSVTYTYTVQPGDNDADGIAIGALALGTSTIRDANGNDAVLSLAGHLPSTAGIAVDTQAPSVSAVVAPANGTYTVGAQLDFTVAFDESITVSGPGSTLGLMVGSTARSATLVSISGNTVTYRYTVQAGDNDADGIVVGALALNGSTIRDAAGNNATLALAGHVPPLGGVLVDTTVPGPGDTQAPSVTAVFAPANGTYDVGAQLDFTVAFDENVIVSGPGSTLGLMVGSTARSATLVSISGNTVTYRYTVQAGDNDADGIAVGALALNGTTIRDAAGNDATLALAGHVPPLSGVLVDTTVPGPGDTQAPSVTAVFAPANGTYDVGAHLDFTVAFDENVIVSGPGSTLGLMVGGTARSATLVSISGNTVTYRYTVQAGDNDADGITVGALALNGSTIRDAAGNNATLALAGHVPPLGGVLVDTTVPGPGDTQAPSVTAVFAPANGTYDVGAHLDFTVAFDETVIVSGPGSTLGLMVGSTARSATLVSISGNTVTYRYTVQASDNDADGIAVGALALNGSTIRDAAGNDATLALAGHVPPLGGVLVDTTVPGPGDTQAPSVTAVFAPANGTYDVGAQLDFTVAFDETVIVSGPGSTLGLTVGGTAHVAHFVSASGNTVTYRYTVQAGDNDADGIAVGALALNGSTIRDVAGNDATLALAGRVPPLGGVLVDTTVPGPGDTQAPSVTAVFAPANGTYAVGAQLDFTVAFDETIIVSGPGSTLGLTVGGTAHVAHFVSASGNTVTYRYTVQAGDNDADGIAVGALALNGSTIRDAAGNDATLALAGRVPPLGGVLVDTTVPGPGDTQAPSVTAVFAPANGTYDVGAHLDFTVAFDENVIVSGPGSTLGLMVGGTARSATLVSISGNTVTYRYTVQAGDNDADGITVGALALNGSTIRDAAGNDATLALAGRVPPLGGVLIDSTAPDTTAPVFNRATVNGRTLVLTYDETGLLDAAHGPAAGAFTVLAGGTSIAISAVVVNGAARTVTLTLATAVGHDQPVTVAYADPTGGDDVAAIQDAAGNDAASLTATPVLNTTPPIVTPPPIDPPPPAGETIDGMLVRVVTVTHGDGTVSQVVTVPVVTATRVEQVGDKDMADIPLVKNAAGASLLTAQLPLGFGLEASGAVRPASAAASLAGLVDEIRAHTPEGSVDQAQLTKAGSGYVDTLDDAAPLLVQTIVAGAAPDAAPGTLVISGAPAAAGHVPTALVIDAHGLPAGSSIALHDVEFAVVVGAVRIVSDAGAQVVWGDSAAQEIMLGAGDDVLHGGAGNDIVGSAAGSDRVFADEGDDLVFGGQDNDTIDGGSGSDTVQLAGNGRADYSLRVVDGNLVVTHRAGGSDGTDVVSNVETLRFMGADTSVAGTATRLVEALTGTQASVTTVDAMVRMAEQGASLSQVAHALYDQAVSNATLDDAGFVSQLYRNVFDRAADGNGLAYWMGKLGSGAARADVALEFADSAEKLALPTDLDFGATDVATLVRLYGALYDRAPDEAGLNWWIGAHEGGMSMAAIADAFVADAEGRGHYGTLGDAEFTAALYRTALHREPGAGEAQYWGELLAGGQVDRGDVLLAFAESAEMVALVGPMSTSIDTL